MTWQAHMFFTNIHTPQSLLKLLIKIYGYDTNHFGLFNKSNDLNTVDMSPLISNLLCGLVVGLQFEVNSNVYSRYHFLVDIWDIPEMILLCVNHP
jgi:hypothetical protein